MRPSEKSLGETESSGSVASHLERHSDEQVQDFSCLVPLLKRESLSSMALLLRCYLWILKALLLLMPPQCLDDTHRNPSDIRSKLIQTFDNVFNGIGANGFEVSARIVDHQSVLSSGDNIRAARNLPEIFLAEIKWRIVLFKHPFSRWTFLVGG